MKIFGNSCILILALNSFGCARPDWVPDAKPSPRLQKQPSESACAEAFNSGLCLDWSWEKFQTEDETGTLTLRFSKEGQAQDPENQVAVLLWMPAMTIPHGAAPARITRLAPGLFRAENIYFTMPGDWEIHFQLKSGSRVVEEIIEKFHF